MPLPKHLRPRYRYLAVWIEAWPDADIDRRSFQAALWESSRSLLGDVGSAEADPGVLRFGFASGVGEAVVRTRRDEVGTTRAALACIDAIRGHPVGIFVRGASGTVRACEEKYIGERPESVTERNVAFGSAAREAVVRDGRADVRTDGAYTGATDLDLEPE